MSRPEMLPGGEFILFTLARTGGGLDWDKAQIVIQSVKTSERRVLVSAGSDGRYVPTGHIIYALGGVLFAVPFDLGHLTVSGEPVPIVEGVRRGIGGGGAAAQFTFSGTGSLVYFPGPATRRAAQREPTCSRRSHRLASNGSTCRPVPTITRGFAGRPNASPSVLTTGRGRQHLDLPISPRARRCGDSPFGGKNRFPVWSAKGRARARFSRTAKATLASSGSALMAMGRSSASRRPTMAPFTFRSRGRPQVIDSCSA